MFIKCIFNSVIPLKRDHISNMTLKHILGAANFFEIYFKA